MPIADTMEDRVLLREYREHGSEAAFRALVERHLGLVHAAARRQVGDSQLAEEVSQAVFLLLARKAQAPSGETRLGVWLYRTTGFVAPARPARSYDDAGGNRKPTPCNVMTRRPNPIPGDALPPPR